jgi:hypothetical protein
MIRAVAGGRGASRSTPPSPGRSLLAILNIRAPFRLPSQRRPRGACQDSAGAPDYIHVPSLFVVESDVQLRSMVVETCRAAGIEVVGVARIAEMERWPEGQILLTDIAHLTTWWTKVGALEVIALVDHPEEGFAALTNGATGWLRRDRISMATLKTIVALNSLKE